MLNLAASRTPSLDAVVDGDRRLSYAELRSTVWRAAQGLGRAGVTPGQRVVMAVANSLEAAATFLAIQVAGGVAVPINHRIRAENLLRYLAHPDAVALVFDEFSQAALDELPADVSGRLILVGLNGARPRDLAARVVTCLADLSDGPEVTAEARDEQALSLVLSTSGSTGEPKGIPLSHRQSLARVCGLYMNHGFRHGDGMRCLGIMPIYHTVGVHAALLLSLHTNGTYYAVRQFQPVEVLRLIEAAQITYVFAAPAMFHALVEAIEQGAFDLTSVTDAMYAGQSMDPALVCRVARHFNGNLTHIYGNTETYNSLYYRQAASMPGALLPGVFHRVRLVAVGQPAIATVEPGASGEIIIDLSSDEAFSGYDGNPEATAERVRDGWYYTGDLAIEDDEGRIFIKGRADDMIISGGENIYPADVETAILAHPGVSDCAVTAVPDERWGQAVTALVVVRDPLVTAEDVHDFCRVSLDLEGFKRPKTIFVVDDLPIAATGKRPPAQIRALAEELAEQSSGSPHPSRT